MTAADKQLAIMIATTPGVDIKADAPIAPQASTTQDTPIVEAVAAPVSVPQELTDHIETGTTLETWTKAALDCQTKVRDDANAERTAAWAVIKSSHEASEPAMKHKPRVHGPTEENIAYEAACERVRARLKEARRLFDIDWPAPPQPSVYLSSAYHAFIRQRHERNQIAKVLGPALEAWESQVESWEQSVKDGLSKRKARAVEDRKQEVRRAIEEDEKREQLREEARNFKMLDGDGKLRRLP